MQFKLELFQFLCSGNSSTLKHTFVKTNLDEALKTRLLKATTFMTKIVTSIMKITRSKKYSLATGFK